VGGLGGLGGLGGGRGGWGKGLGVREGDLVSEWGGGWVRERLMKQRRGRCRRVVCSSVGIRNVRVCLVYSMRGLARRRLGRRRGLAALVRSICFFVGFVTFRTTTTPPPPSGSFAKERERDVRG
jgi:hypothetical protein